MTLPEHRPDLFCFLFHTPQNSEWIATLAGADESALLERLDGIAIGRLRAYFFIIFQVPQNWTAAERISFKLVSMLHVRKQVLFSLGEFRQEISSFLLRHCSRPYGTLFGRTTLQASSQLSQSLIPWLGTELLGGCDHVPLC